MVVVEKILSKRELIVLLGEENHSLLYNPSLLNCVWPMPTQVPSKNVLIIPIQGLREAYKLSKEEVKCYGRFLWVLFVRSSFLTHYAILFDAFAQTDDNSYFSIENISFLQKCNWISISICDIGVYKMRSLVNMLNSALLSLERTNISICLVTILGYNTRGYTDIETEDEDEIYHKDFYLKSDCGMAVTDDAFAFLQIKGKFNMCDLSYISSLTKSASEVKLGEIKARTVEYISILKPLLDFGFLETHIKSLGKGNLEDFVEQLNNWLMKVNFQGDLIDIQWSVEYDRMCQNVCNSTNENRENFVADLISAIGENINKTVNYIESI